MTIVNYVCSLMKHKTLYLVATYLFKVFSKARNSRLMALVGFLKALPQQCQCTTAYSYLNAHKKKKKSTYCYSNQ